MLNPISKLSAIFKTWRIHRNMPLRIEFVVTDYCNLNCKGCSHYSPLAQKEFENINSLKDNIRHIGNVCGDGLKSAYLIGGETLLYPDLIEAMNCMRESFPTQDLYIFTNGLMLPKMKDMFWEETKKNNFIIALTRYPINFNYDAVEDLCREKGVEVRVFGDRSLSDSFFRFSLDPNKRQNAWISHFKCMNYGCVSVIGDRIFPCSISGCVTHLNKAKGTKFEHVDGDWINVKDVKSATDIKRLRDRPVPFCSYCVVPIKSVKYGPSKREVSEWVD